MSYDSTKDTSRHIVAVRSYILRVVQDLQYRAGDHDKSKYQWPEKEMFDKYTPLLRDTTYGSEEYEGYRKAMGEALDHHYEVNDHHPEHFPDGIHGMNLIQLIEMLCDWKAATERHADGDLAKSITLNAERFGYGTDIERMLYRTAEYLGWL